MSCSKGASSNGGPGTRGAALPVPASTKLDLADAAPLLHGAVVTWMQRHGKMIRPRISQEQLQELLDCFHLMDLDNSGAINASELKEAFQLLGLQMTSKEVKEVLQQVDSDGSGEVDVEEFLTLMTNKLKSLAQQQEERAGSQLPFELMSCAYRRKRYLEHVLAGKDPPVPQNTEPTTTISSNASSSDPKQAPPHVPHLQLPARLPHEAMSTNGATSRPGSVSGSPRRSLRIGHSTCGAGGGGVGGGSRGLSGSGVDVGSSIGLPPPSPLTATGTPRPASWARPLDPFCTAGASSRPCTADAVGGARDMLDVGFWGEAACRPWTGVSCDSNKSLASQRSLPSPRPITPREYTPSDRSFTKRPVGHILDIASIPAATRCPLERVDSTEGIGAKLSRQASSNADQLSLSGRSSVRGSGGVQHSSRQRLLSTPPTEDIKRWEELFAAALQPSAADGGMAAYMRTASVHALDVVRQFEAAGGSTGRTGRLPAASSYIRRFNSVPLDTMPVATTTTTIPHTTATAGAPNSNPTHTHHRRSSLLQPAIPATFDWKKLTPQSSINHRLVSSKVDSGTFLSPRSRLYTPPTGSNALTPRGSAGAPKRPVFGRDVWTGGPADA